MMIIKNGDDLKLLKLIYLHDMEKIGVIPSKLIREAGLRKSTFYKFINLYEEKGLIKRVPCDSDSRIKKIFITEQGIKTLSYWDRILTRVQKDLEDLGIF